MPEPTQTLIDRKQQVVTLAQQGKWPEAKLVCKDLCEQWPEDSEGWVLQARVNFNMGHFADGKACCQKALALSGDTVPTLQLLALLHERSGEPAEAISTLKRALIIQPQSAALLGRLANILEKRGEHQQAYEYIRSLIQEGTLHVDVALGLGQIARSLDRTTEAITYIESTIADTKTTPAQRTPLHFSLGRLLEAQGDYDEAFAHMQTANQLAAYSFDTQNHQRSVQQSISTCTDGFMEKYRGSGHDSDKPVFIVGMPRSGTTLVEKILASHSQVIGVGELQAIPQIAISLTSTNSGGYPYMHMLDKINKGALGNAAGQYLQSLPTAASSARHTVDKQLMNFFYLGLIEMLFPNARIIHCRRHPLDTCLSCYFMEFGPSHPYAYDLTSLGHFYQQYERMMNHWHSVLKTPIFEIEYESLVDDPEKKSRELIEHMGLEWEPQCLTFYETQQHSNTASYSQVKQPIYKKAVHRWKNYRKHLGPLEKALENYSKS